MFWHFFDSFLRFFHTFLQFFNVFWHFCQKIDLDESSKLILPDSNTGTHRGHPNHPNHMSVAQSRSAQMYVHVVIIIIIWQLVINGRGYYNHSMMGRNTHPSQQQITKIKPNNSNNNNNNNTVSSRCNIITSWYAFFIIRSILCHCF